MDIETGLALFVLLIFGLIGSALAKPWEVPDKKCEKWKRSLVLGIFTSIAIPFSIMILGWNKVNIKNSSEVIRAVGSLFICLGLPAGIMTTVGFRIGYRQLEWLLKKKEGVRFKTKKNT